MSGDRNLWNLAPPPHFQGFREDLPLTVYERHLPHWRQDGATYFVTFRLADALPQNKLDYLSRLKSEWERQHAAPRSREVLELWARIAFEHVECWLDQSFGLCVLRDNHLAATVVEAIYHFDGERYELDCLVVMANHVHVILRPLFPAIHSLEDIVGSWKSFSSRRINAALGQEGELWEQESYDRIIRDAEHLWRTIQYIGRNPEKVNLPRDSCNLWIRPEWESLGWTFDWRRS